MPRGIPGSGPFAKKSAVPAKKTAKKAAAKTKSVKTAPKTVKVTRAKKSAAAE